MSDMPQTQEAETAEVAATEAPATAGGLLRRAREAQGMHIGALAVSLRVPLKKLEALEADRLDLLPDAVFTRALASKVCRALKIDAAPILQCLPQTAAPHLRTDGVGMNVPFQRPGASVEGTFWTQLPKPALAAVLVLLAGALTLLFMPEEQESRPQAEVASAPVQSLPAPVDAAPPAAEVPSTLATAVPAAVVPPPSTPAAPVAPATTAAAPALPAGGEAAATRHVLQFKTRGASWVEVLDAGGTVLLRRNLEPGESVGVSGALPLSVVVGRADATEVWVRGKPFSLQSVSSENVARFEVKP